MTWRAVEHDISTLLAVSALASVFVFHPIPEVRSDEAEPHAPLKVAFIGDQGSERGAIAVLQLIKAEEADLVLHQGDLDYRDDPALWDKMISDVLGDDFPYLAAIGNHDRKRWFRRGGYQDRLESRLDKSGGAQCTGDLGIMSACTYRGLLLVQSGVGTWPKAPDHPVHISYVRNQLAQTDAIWRICAWHKNQTDMQLGEKPNEVGWGLYEACRKGGAIIATGHEHSYARTHLMSSFEDLKVASTSGTLEIEEGKSFAFVSGLGGRSIRNQDRHGDWWAAVHTSDQEANFGALFCTFFVNGQPEHASCYFKDIDGKVPDRFDVISKVGAPELKAQHHTRAN